MREDYLHYLWKYQKWKNLELKTSQDLPVKVVSPGSHNLLSGPDFFNSRVVIGDQQWAGNVEIHINSSDWYLHGHEQDSAYDNVVLHVVWNHDLEIFRRDNSPIPVLELRSLVSKSALHQYEHLLENVNLKWINCENDFAGFDQFTLDNWIERLYFEKLEQKTSFIFDLLERCKGDWEEVLFRMLARNFGLNVNGDAFFSIAGSIPFSVIKKCQKKRQQLEALFLGQAGLLENSIEEVYFQTLQKEYFYLKRKYGLSRKGVLPVKYFRLRPDNFPEIRIIQLAIAYNRNSSLFAALQKASKIEDFRSLFSGEVSDFWKGHYTFRKEHPGKSKKLTSSFKDLLIINTLVPLKFCYLQKQGKEDNELLLNLMSLIKVEENQVIKKFNDIRTGCANNALKSQALLHLKREYCDKNRCLYCSLGLKLLQKE